VTARRSGPARPAFVPIGFVPMAIVTSIATAPMAAGCDEPTCGPEGGVVVDVIDGDTLVLAGGERVRHLLVDAPEADACFGASASRFHRDLVLGARVELDDDEVCRDRFDRRLAYVAHDGRDVGRLLVERGYACVLHVPPTGDERLADYRAAEAAARAAGRGLWAGCAPRCP
jgi:micrococcal nuclease